MCWRLDRLGRNLKHLITLLEDLQALGVAFVSLAEGYRRHDARRETADAHPWKSATSKRYEKLPHQYTLRKQWANDEDFIWCVV